MGEINKLSVVLPCCNESGNIQRFERELIACLSPLPFLIEYIAVDDGSTDDTAAELKSIAARVPNFHVFRHEKNLGLGAALKTGFKNSRGDALLSLDADLTFPPTETSKLLAHYSKNVACVSGSAIKGAFEDVSFLRRSLSRGVNTIYRFLLKRDVTSLSSMFRLYRTSALEKLQLGSVSFDINAEILIKLIQAGEDVREVPVTLRTRSWGRSKIKFMREIGNHIRLFWRLKFLERV